MVCGLGEWFRTFGGSVVGDIGNLVGPVRMSLLRCLGYMPSDGFEMAGDPDGDMVGSEVVGDCDGEVEGSEMARWLGQRWSVTSTASWSGLPAWATSFWVTGRWAWLVVVAAVAAVSVAVTEVAVCRRLAERWNTAAIGR